MFPSSHRWWFRRGVRLRLGIPLLLVLVVIAALASTGLGRDIAAQPGTRTPAGDATPEGFAAACVSAGGSPVEVRDASGAVILTSCEYSGGGFSECDWIDRTCTYGFRGAPPSGPLDDIAVDPDDGGGVLVEDTPTALPTDPAVPTAEATTTAEPTEPSPNAKVFVIKYTCPDAVSYDHGAFDAYVDACPQTTEGVSFTLDGTSTGNPGEQRTDAYGQLSWSELEADHLYLTEEVPSGYGTPVTYCVYTGGAAPLNDNVQGFPVSAENRIEFDLATGQAITCAWFNIAASPTSDPAAATPVGRMGTTTTATTTGTTTGTGAAPGTFVPVRSATLILNTFGCEPGYDHPAEEAEPARECRDQSRVVAFELAHIDKSANGTAQRRGPGNETGVVTFTDVDPADYRLTEVEFPAGNTAFILACQSNRRDFGGYPFNPFVLTATDGSVDVSLLAGETLTCDWYDVPAAEAVLSVQVYACGSAQPSVAVCDPASGPFLFVLAPVSGEGEAITFETEVDGAARLATGEGSYTLTEVGQQPCAIEATHTDAEGNLQLGAEQEVVVQVFHCD